MKLEVIHERPAASSRGSLLFVHGAWHGAWCWEQHFLPWFAQRGFDAYAVSLRGHGASEGHRHLRRFGIARYAADVRSVVESIAGDPILIGHSMGGLVVQRYLEKHSAPGAVLLAPVPVTGALGATLRIARRHPGPFFRCNLLLKLWPIVGSPQLARELLFSVATPEDVVQETWRRLQDESYRAYIEMVVRRPRPRRIATPVFVVGAGADRIFSVAEIERTAAAYETDATILPGLGHDMMLEPGWEDAARAVLRSIESL